jgi:hypothetical protein
MEHHCETQVIRAMNDPATIALCVGHSRLLANGRPEGGAWTHDGSMSEWKWNSALVRVIAAELHDHHGIAAFIFNDYGPREYYGAMDWLGKEIRELGNIKLAAELHFNSSSPSANGHEWIHWAGSIKGRLAATELHLSMMRKFPGIRARGVKTPIDGRGAEFLKKTHCPAVICEPFFGSNAHDWETMRRNPEKLATAIADGLAAAHRRL